MHPVVAADAFERESVPSRVQDSRLHANEISNVLAMAVAEQQAMRAVEFARDAVETDSTRPEALRAFDAGVQRVEGDHAATNTIAIAGHGVKAAPCLRPRYHGLI